jgi:hypothetical protein
MPFSIFDFRKQTRVRVALLRNAHIGVPRHSATCVGSELNHEQIIPHYSR